MANWAKIKIAYLEGQKVVDIAKKHKLNVQTIYNKALEEKWALEKSKIQEELTEQFVSEKKRIVSIALEKLETILSKEEIRDCDLISAIKAALDISGLKKEKVENTHNIPMTPKRRKEIAKEFGFE